jgi:predicted Zn finger-like uncharacterized protein
MARFACPSCSGQFEVASEDMGKVVRCPHCGTMLGTGQPAAGPQVGPQTLPPQTPEQAQPPGQMPPDHPAPQLPQAGPVQGPMVGQPYPSAGPPAENPAGVWSFILAIIFYLAQIAIAGVLIYQAGTRQSGLEQRLQLLINHPPLWMTVASIVLLIVLLLSFFLGLYAISRPNRAKGLAAAGLILSGLGLLCGIINVFGSGR